MGGVAHPQPLGPASPEDGVSPSPSAQMVYLGRVYNGLEILGSRGGLKTWLPGGACPGHPLIQVGAGLVTPRSPGPWPSLHPALLATTEARQWPVRTGLEGGSQGIGCGAQGGKKGARPCVGLDYDVCRVPFVPPPQALMTHALGGMSCTVVKNIAKSSEGAAVQCYPRS